MSGSFALDLKAFAAKAKDRANEAVGRVVIGIAAEVDQRSPVGDPSKWSAEFKAVGTELGWYGEGYVGGRFRGSWQLGIGAAPTGASASIYTPIGRANIGGIDPSGVETQARIRAAVPDDASGKVYYLVSNLPYSRRLEEGYSKQAPKGIVGLTAARFQSIVKEQVGAMQ